MLKVNTIFPILLSPRSYPTYVVKDKEKKVIEMDQESATDIALYDVVDETNKKRVAIISRNS